MALAYFDSSAFVKLIIDGDGSDLAAAIWDACDAPVSSRLAYPEVAAALAAAVRAHGLEAADHDRAAALWETYWAATRPVELTPTVMFDAARCATEFGLRGADAVHLASANALGAPDLLFIAWDLRLREGAVAAGVTVIPPAM